LERAEGFIKEVGETLEGENPQLKFDDVDMLRTKVRALEDMTAGVKEVLDNLMDSLGE
jgi:hypothetical protein